MAVNENDVLRIDVIGQFSAADVVINSYQLQCFTAGGLTDEQAIQDMDEWVDALYSILRVLMTAVTIWRRYRITNVTQDLVLGEFNLTTLLPGTAAGDPGAPGVALLAYLNTGVPRVQLRKYWGPLAESHLESSGVVSGSVNTAVTNALAFLLVPAVLTHGDWEYGYFSPVTLTFLPPTSGAWTNIPAYQRRRKQGRGI